MAHAYLLHPEQQEDEQAGTDLHSSLNPTFFGNIRKEGKWLLYLSGFPDLTGGVSDGMMVNSMYYHRNHLAGGCWYGETTLGNITMKLVMNDWWSSHQNLSAAQPISCNRDRLFSFSCSHYPLRQTGSPYPLDRPSSDNGARVGL